jgi:alpha-glucosidase (family GH31 glycosyl hydrolase)
MTMSGDSLMRAMWNEFPDDVITYDLDSQFMFGKDILVAPKLSFTTDIADDVVSFYLPTSELWYNY